MLAGTILFTCMGYFEIRDHLPDQLNIVEGEEAECLSRLKKPWFSLDDAIPVSGGERYHLQCDLFGLIPLKQIKVQVVEPTDIYVSGNTVGVYMETQGVLIILQRRKNTVKWHLFFIQKYRN